MFTYQVYCYCFWFLFFGVFPGNEIFARPSTLELTQVYYEAISSMFADDVAKAKIFLQEYDRKANALQIESGESNWQYETDLTEEHLKRVVEVGEKVSNFYLNSSNKARSIKSIDLKYNLSRQIKLITRTVSPSEKELRAEITTLVGNMTKIFGSALVAKKSENNTTANLTNSDLSAIFTRSRNISELNWAWKGWRDAVGPPTRPLFASLVDYLNIGAREHGWLDYGRFLRSDYEMSDMLEESLDEVWTAIEPLYKELHAYVRFRLSKQYEIGDDACIPASLLGGMYAQDWEAIFDLVKPNESSKTFDVTDQLKRQKYTVTQMFKLAESFFTSIGLDAMPETFWNRSVLVKPKNKEMVCHASAWDVSRDDVRIKMCTDVNQKDLTTIHHEMGHIEYFLAYKNQPSIFRAGANPGFHEAIGDTISLSVETPAYLHKVGLLDSPHMNKDDEISFLLNQALRRISPIPYNLLVDKWRWRIYEGVITEETYNKAWWEHRIKYQGVEPPVMRPADSFDAASKYHIGANVPYVPYFISYVLQFQLHQILCSFAGHNGPLHACSIYNSTKAGTKLRKLLSAGRSQPWPLILQSFSDQRTLKADAILEYFSPLKKWLVEKREKEKYRIGWKEESSVPIYQAQLQKPESGKERSSIFKAANLNPNSKPNYNNDNNNNINENNNNSNNNIEDDKTDDKTTLSFNIPPDALKNLLNNYPEIKQQYEGSKNSSMALVENATNPTDNQMAMRTQDLSTSAQTTHVDQNLNHQENTSLGVDSNTAAPSSAKTIPVSVSDLSKLLGNEKLANPTIGNGVTGQGSNASPSIPINQEGSPARDSKNAHTPTGASLENTQTVIAEEKHNTNNQTATVDKTTLLNTIKNLLSNNVSLFENQASQGMNSDEKITSNVNMSSSSTGERPLVPDTGNIVSKEATLSHGQIESLPASSIAPQLLSALQNSITKNNSSRSPETVNQNPSPVQPIPESLISSKTSPSLLNEALVNPEGKQRYSNSNEKLLEQASSLSKEELLKVLKDALINKQNINNESTVSNIQNTQQTSTPESDNQNVQESTNSMQTPTNDDITSGLKKLLGMKDDNKVNTTTIAEDGSKFTKLIETCIRSIDDPKCLHGKIIKEGGYLPQQKNGLDSAKQTISISPSLLVQKLMERKKADESTPDAVVNAAPSYVPSALPSSEEDAGSKKTTSVDPKTLMGLLKAALNGQSTKSTTTSTRQDVANSTDSKSNKTMCNKQLIKRGFSINYNCGGVLSNYTRVGLTGKSPVSTTDLLRTLITNSGGGEIVDKNTPFSAMTSSSSLPPTHLQKTASGFQVDFDLNVKDQIPKEEGVVSGTLKTLSSGRQQHIDLYNTPKGVAVKPKSSVQLLKPQFVPVAQSRDNVELKERKTVY